MAGDGKNDHDHDPLEVTLYVDDAESGLRPGDHANNFAVTIQAAVDLAVEEENWGPGPHWANIALFAEFKKRNPGDIGAYRVVLTE